MSNPKVLNQPPINKSDTVTVPNIGEIEPATGHAKSVIMTGKNPTNFIGQPLPEAVNPKVKEGALGANMSDNGTESTVIPTPGA